MTAKYLDWVWWPASSVGKMKLAHAWEESKLVKDFALALQANLVGVELAADLKEELVKIGEWGHRHAN